MGPLHIRVAAWVATVLIFVPYAKAAAGNAALLAALACLLLAYSLLIRYRRSDWSWRPYALVTGLAAAVFAAWTAYAGSAADGHAVLPLAWPMLWMLASMPRKRMKSSIALAALLVAAAAMLDRDQPNLGNMLVGAVGLYLGCRGITFVREGYRISAQHLAELDEAHQRLRRAHEQLQEAAADSMRYAALSERTRLARDIHDGIGHRLTSLIIQLQALEMMLPGDPQAASEQVKAMLEVARQAMKEVRHAVREWSEDESGAGLIALKGLTGQTAAHSGLRVDFAADEDRLPEIPPSIGVVLYRVLQEALTNAMKHSDATAVQVSLGMEGDCAVLTVTDNGSFTEGESFTPGFGLKGMIERCEAAGGRVSFASNVPQGFAVRAEIPLPKEANAS